MDSFSLTIAGMLLYVLLAWALLQFIGSQRKDRVSLHLDKRLAQTELAFASARTHYQDVSKVMMGELATLPQKRTQTFWRGRAGNSKFFFSLIMSAGKSRWMT